MQSSSALFQEKLKLDCYICKRKRTGGYKLNCDHTYCIQCFQHLLFIKCIRNVKDSPSINIECSCGSTASFISLEEIFNFLVKNNQQDQSQIDNEKCQFHPSQPPHLFCKTCNKDICVDCSKTEHKEHKYTEKKIYAEQFHNYLKSIPLRYSNLDQFVSNFNDLARKFKGEVEESFKLTCENIDLLIKNLTDLKVELAKMIKERLSRGVLLMKIIKILYVNYYMNLANKDKITDIFTLRYLRDISYEFVDFKLEMNSSISDGINSITSKSKELKTTTDSFLKIFVDYQEPARTFTQEQTLLGHKKEVTALIKLQDGRILTGGGDYSIRFWELKDNIFENTITIEEFTGFVMALYQLNDKRILSTARDNNNTRIWDDSSGKYTCEITLSEHTQYVTSMIQLHDNRLVTASRDCHICIWEPNKKLFQCKKHLKEHANGVYSLVELSDTQIASGSDDKTIKIWQAKGDGFECVQTLMQHKRRVKALTKLKGDNGRFISGGEDHMIIMWERKGNRYDCLFMLPTAHQKGITFLMMLKDERLLSGGKDKTIRIWQVGEKELILKEQLQGHNHVVYGVSELDDGRLASCGGDNSIIIWKSGAMHEY